MVFQRITDTFEMLQNTKRQVKLFEMQRCTMFITALCVIFLMKLRWPKIANDSKSAAWKCPYLIISNLHFHCLNSLNSLVRDLIFSGGLFAPSIG